MEVPITPGSNRTIWLPLPGCVRQRYGVILEATKPDASYTEYARISTYSGLPTVLGWPMHEAQWRGTYDPQGTRQDDIRRLYGNLQLG